MPSRLKRAVLAAGIGLPLLLMAGAAGVDRLRSGPPPLEGDRAVTGLEAPVEIVRDSLGIPHVWARSRADALFTQGYLHARDRLWQMEMFRRVLQGRLSELFGERTLEADRFLRTLGMDRAAHRGAERLGPEVRTLLEAYADGVSAAVRGWEGPLPPEFLVLRARPEGWSVPLVIGIEKLMAWDLTAYDRSLDLARARRRLGPERYHWIAPAYPEWGPTILDGYPDRDGVEVDPAAPWEAAAGRGSAVGEAPVPDAPPGELLHAARVPDAARPFLRAASAVRASNSWVVGGGRTRSGRPLLANDMHLGLEAPNIWYLVGLHAPGLDVVGMSIPGAPGVVAGRTGGVAWGFTNAYVDDADLFVERLAPGDSTRYRTPDGPRAFQTRTEVIRIRGGGADTLEVRSTRHGPVMTPVEDRSGDELLALRWVAHDAATTAGALLAMNRARTAEEMVEAMAGFGNPHQNVVFADTAGTIGYGLAGRIPLRADGTPPILPVPGWTGEHDWTGFLPYSDHPRVLNPDEDFVVAANNRQSRGPAADRISGGMWGDPYRATRIRERIVRQSVHDAGSMRRIQLDVRSAFARRHRPAAVRAFRDARLDSAAAALEEWSLRAERGSREATLFYAWIDALREGLRERLYDGEGGYLPLVAVSRMLEGRIPGGEELSVSAASRALETARGRRWGEVHQLVLDHPLRGVPVVGSLFGFGRGPLPRSGAHHTVNVAEFSPGPPYRVQTGPSQRHVSDLADPAGAGAFILPGGQSGLPGDVHAWDQLSRWRGGELWTLPLERSSLEARSVGRFRLVPSVENGGGG